MKHIFQFLSKASNRCTILFQGCVDDFSARALGCDLMVHYGHSCLIPIDRTSNIKMLYVFVSINIDPVHFIESIVVNFGSQGIAHFCIS